LQVRVIESHTANPDAAAAAREIANQVQTGRGGIPCAGHSSTPGPATTSPLSCITCSRYWGPCRPWLRPTVSLSNGVRRSNNTDGLLLRHNATARIVFDTQFDANTRGIHARNESLAYFAGALIAFSAKGTDVSCDELSLSSRASLTDATTVACVNAN
jgi:hypothetical protein